MVQKTLIVALTAALVLALGLAGLGVGGLNRRIVRKPNPAPASAAAPSTSLAAKADLIEVYTPLPGSVVANSVAITGRARGKWFFEATFPVEIRDEGGNVLGKGTARAESEWTTANFVPFAATFSFAAPHGVRGTIVLKKDNPSGLPQNDDELLIPVRFR